MSTIRHAVCIVCEAFLRALSHAAGPEGCIRAFADDVGMVLHNLHAQAPDVEKLFTLIERIAGLALNGKKCVIVPLWAYDASAIRAWLSLHVQAWTSFAISDGAKYLGIWLGLGALSKSWEEPMSKYMERCRNLRGMGVGLQASAYQYNIFCVSVLSYVGQVSFAPPEALKQERFALQLLTAGPWNTFTGAFLVRMDTCGFASAFTNLHTSNHAAMVRTAMHNSKSFASCLSRLRARSSHDTTSLMPVMHQWHKRALVFQLAKAVDDATSLGADAGKEMLPLHVPFDPRALSQKRLALWIKWE